MRSLIRSVVVAMTLAAASGAVRAAPDDEARSGQSAVASTLVGKALTADTYAAFRDVLTPSEDEIAFRSIGWRPTLWGAVVDAHAAKKPILLWAMNGHPLGCT